jgi:hypothetical protein
VCVQHFGLTFKQEGQEKKMGTLQSYWRALKPVTLTVMCGLFAVAARPANAAVTIAPFGSAAFQAAPTWQPTDFHFFAGVIGDNSNNFANFIQTQQTLFPAPGYGFDGTNGIIPGTTPVAGPYTNKMSLALAAHGIADQTSFTLAQYTLPFAVYLAWIDVPTAAAPIGSSPDFASGPIISNSIAPIVFGGTTDRNGVLFDPNWTGQINPTTSLGLANPGQGYSHLPVFTAETFDFGSGPSADGSYVHHFTQTDAQGNGWSITAPYTVVPEPGVFAMILPASLMLLGRRRLELIPGLRPTL